MTERERERERRKRPTCESRVRSTWTSLALDVSLWVPTSKSAEQFCQLVSGLPVRDSVDAGSDRA